MKTQAIKPVTKKEYLLDKDAQRIKLKTVLSRAVRLSETIMAYIRYNSHESGDRERAYGEFLFATLL